MAKLKVKKGETISEISRRTGIPEWEIRQANRGVETLSTGQTIRLPDRYTEKKQAGYYQTGPDERITFTRDGKTIRVPPNSYTDPHLTNQYDPGAKPSMAPGSLEGIPLQNYDNSSYTPEQYKQIYGDYPAGDPRRNGGQNAKRDGTDYTNKKQAGYYQTGDGERLEFTRDGQTVRLGPNSNTEPVRPVSPFQQFWNQMQGLNPDGSTIAPSNVTGVRGSLPQQIGSFKLAAPVQAGRGPGPEVLAQNGNVLGIQPWNGRTGVRRSYSTASYAPTGYHSYASPQENMGLDPSYAYMYRNNGIGAQGGIGANTPNAAAPFWNQGVRPAFSYTPVGQPNSYTPYQGQLTSANRFSYSPQGQPNSYTPYKPISPQRQGPIGSEYANTYQYNPVNIPKPTQPPANNQLTSNGWMYSPTYTNSYGSTHVKTAQEAFQQGQNVGNKRWWIGNNGRKYEDQRPRNTITPMNIKEINWRA